ncbi:hypothetical protein HUG15_07875 [Salicibibacter cibarius]|uniref:Uncharacterized protein n=1 Tax=Salicibibacter cibarius TaxID=2743000 RepID=A0A7T6Z1Z1_9BACI|nr:hypothetical protein [Salicibibacter cibarius]QQK75508.1 hypothetical protein HUG15_07875 [Salicibibacter cibarius]
MEFPAVAEITNDGDPYIDFYWDYGFEEEEISPVNSLTGEILFDITETDRCELVYGRIRQRGPLGI